MNDHQNYLLTYNQHRVSEIHTEFRDKKTGASTACAVCSCARLISDLLVPYYPFQLINLFRENDLFATDRDGSKTLIRWSGFHKIWNSLYTIPYLFNKYHMNIETIKPPCIISIDGNKFMNGYQSHFLYAVKWLYAGEKRVNLQVYDPWHDRMFLFVPTYAKNIKEISEKVYTIVNFRRYTYSP